MNADVASRVQKPRYSTRNQDSTLRRDASGNDNHRDVLNSENTGERLPKFSYRRKCDELPSGASMVPVSAEKFSGVHAPATVPVPTFFNGSASRLLAFTPEGGIQIGSSQQGYQTFSMSTSGAPKAGPAIVQYTHKSGDQVQQYYVPANNVMVQDTTGDMSAYQICSPTSSILQRVVMAGSPVSLHSPQQVAEEVTRKREVRLMKNREAARECRRKKKEYVKCLENRVAVLENQNKTLIEELRALKDLYSHKIE
ncbi:cAMP responsive element modulator b isoform X2 [Hoplias malabaricus]|uniref:cAMP responsive element modulator b isoform X2 n=1 Tax=Hoplias malabaricus TaxID=27720 RepID=UPI003462AAAD